MEQLYKASTNRWNWKLCLFVLAVRNHGNWKYSRMEIWVRYHRQRHQKIVYHCRTCPGNLWSQDLMLQVDQTNHLYRCQMYVKHRKLFAWKWLISFTYPDEKCDTYLLKKYFSKSSLLSVRLYNDAVDLLRASDEPENNESGASWGLLCCRSFKAWLTWLVMGSRKIVIKLRTAPIHAWVWHLSEFSNTSSILLWSWSYY